MCCEHETTARCVRCRCVDLSAASHAANIHLTTTPFLHRYLAPDCLPHIALSDCSACSLILLFFYVSTFTYPRSWLRRSLRHKNIACYHISRLVPYIMHFGTDAARRNDKGRSTRKRILSVSQRHSSFVISSTTCYSTARNS